jgi:hypothetical protein
LAIETRLKKLTDHRSTGGFELPSDDPRVIPILQELAEKTAEQKRLNDLDAAIDISRLLTGQADGKIEWPEVRTSALVHNSEPVAVCYVALPDVIGMVCEFNRDALTTFLDKKITAASDDSRALTPPQRRDQTAKAMEELFVAETNETTLTLQAWEAGLPVEANPNIDPGAWLEVRCIVAPPVDTSTTPGHSYEVRR